MDTKTVVSPNVSIRPVTAQVNAEGHLTVGGCDTVELAARFGTPLWVMDEETIRAAAAACIEGLKPYPNARALYAGKAFLCLAMCKMAARFGLGLDVVSEGELLTATRAGFPAALTYMHGNNKSQAELVAGVEKGVNIVVDSLDELQDLIKIAGARQLPVEVLFRVIPGVEPDTHEHIKTGQFDSKFGFALESVEEAVALAQSNQFVRFAGVHAHIGSQGKELAPYLENIDILADLCARLKKNLNADMRKLDVGGGLGIRYVETEHPTPIFDWARAIAERAKSAFEQRRLALPELLVEPGRSIVGTAGMTLYRAGYGKSLAKGSRYLALDGGMADNPRPITYQAKYSTCVANRADERTPTEPLTLAGRYCESGDIIVKEAYLNAKSGDLIAVFGTGAYNHSQASNYNRVPRPACVLVSSGVAEVIVERETAEDLLRHDRLPERLRDDG